MSSPPLVPIGELTIGVSSWNPTREVENGSFTYIDISSVDQTEKAITTPQYILCTAAPSRARQLVEENDILVSTVRPNLNSVATIENKYHGATASTGFCVLRTDKNKTFHRYLFHWVKSPSFVANMVQLATGASYPAVSDRVIKDSLIPLPPLSEQKRIAAILDKADAIGKKRKKALELADQFLKSVFLDMFGDPVTNPKGWKPVKLGDDIDFITSGSRGWSQYYSDSGARFIRSLDVQMNRIGTDDVIYVSPPTNAEAKRTAVKPHDVLLTITGSKIGRVCCVPTDIEEAYVSQHVAIIRLSKKLNPIFVSFFLSLDRGGQAIIERHQYGQTKPGLNLDQIRNFSIPSIPSDMQLKFSEIVRKTDEKFCKIGDSRVALDKLFESCSKRAFNGEL